MNSDSPIGIRDVLGNSPLGLHVCTFRFSLFSFFLPSPFHRCLPGLSPLCPYYATQPRSPAVLFIPAWFFMPICLPFSTPFPCLLCPFCSGCLSCACLLLIDTVNLCFYLNFMPLIMPCIWVFYQLTISQYEVLGISVSYMMILHNIIHMRNLLKKHWCKPYKYVNTTWHYTVLFLLL